MGDIYTNFLLGTLITVVMAIGKVGYEKINEVIGLIRTIMIDHQKHDSEINQLKTNQDDHEKRIRELEE